MIYVRKGKIRVSKGIRREMPHRALLVSTFPFPPPPPQPATLPVERMNFKFVGLYGK